MSKEVKIQSKEIEAALSYLKEKTNTLQTTFPHDIGGSNSLDTVTRLNELGMSLELLLLRYQAFLLRNEDATREAVKQLEETDETISQQFLWNLE
ncbi:YwqI/YxiC family protein [Cytobacillus sp. Hz8]|uniref:YwqI/YxiC family protein n=1 Tax=Cytobacillus sp. Hz8 TaxID=3347168 RepID=UPI0035D74794